MSMKPGVSTSPSASMVRSAAGGDPRPDGGDAGAVDEHVGAVAPGLGAVDDVRGADQGAHQK